MLLGNEVFVVLNNGQVLILSQLNVFYQGIQVIMQVSLQQVRVSKKHWFNIFIIINIHHHQKNSYHFLLLACSLSTYFSFLASDPISYFFLIFFKFFWLICFHLRISHLEKWLTKSTIIFGTFSLHLLDTYHFSQLIYFFCLKQVYLL